MNALAIASLLEQVPGVRQAAVVRAEFAGERDLEAYIVPDHDYVERTTANPLDEARQVAQWRTVFDLSEKGTAEPTRELGLSWRLWKSSYTRAPIAPEQLREWRDLTVDRIRALRPRDVFEVGCGTGAILMRVASFCHRYIAADVSAASLQSLGRQMETTHRDWSAVSLLERAAHDLADVDAASFDTVIANSVIQYFPSVEYLERVIAEMVRIAKPAGAVFLGDVRSLELLPAFATSVVLHDAEPSLALSELRRLVGRRLLQDRELVISPAFFLGLARRHAEVENVEVLLKLGSGDNELINYRYDVVLRIAGRERLPEIEPIWRDWNREGLTVATLRELLEPNRDDTIGLSGVPNAGVLRDVKALASCFGSTVPSTVERLRSELFTANDQGTTPAALSGLAREMGYELQASWATCRGDGSFDALFRRRDPDHELPPARVVWPETQSADSRRPTISAPPCRARRRELIRGLQEYAGVHLPANERPNSFTLLREFPPRTVDASEQSSVALAAFLLA